MAFPRYAEKHEHEEFITPSTLRDWRRERGLLPDRAPESAIMLYQNALYEAAMSLETASPIGGAGIYQKVFTLDRTGGRVAVVGGFGIGAPVAAIVLEELIAIGVERVLSIGTAGALQRDLPPGEVVLCMEMEAAALFTVAAYRGVPLASAFCISDSLADAEWNPQFDHPDLAHSLLTLYGAAVDTLAAR